MNTKASLLKTLAISGHRRRAASLAAALITSAITMSSGSASASVVFSDSAYDPTDYTVAFDYLGSQSVALTSSTFAAAPSTGLTFTVNVNGPNNGNGVLTGVLNNTFVYDPATQGAISTISASTIKTFTLTNDVATAGSITYGNRFRPLIEQDGNFYTAAITGPSVGPVPGGGTQTVMGTLSASGLTLNDFFYIDPTTESITASHGSLNFDGNPLTFGVVQFLGSGGTQVTSEIVYKDLTIGVNAVPLPAAAPLFAAALLGLGVFGATRKKVAASALRS